MADQQANWVRYLRSSGVTDWYALPPAAQQHLSAQFPGWVRRQQTIGKVAIAIFAVFVIVMIAVALTLI